MSVDTARPTRRQILKAALGGAAGLMLGTVVRADDARIQALGDGLFVIRLPGECNVVAHTGQDGVVLVDGVSAAAADALIKEVAGLPGGGPVTTIFNTHWHPEQTGANELLGKAGRTIIAQENTRLWMTTDVTWPWSGRTFPRAPKIAQPNKTFYTTGQLGADIRYAYLPDAAHTDGDLYVYFPRQNVLAIGDATYGEGWPQVDYATGGWIGGMAGGLQRLLTVANADTRIVPAHGPVFGYDELKRQSAMYTTIYDRLVTLLNKGRSPSEAVEAQPTKDFDARMGNPDEFVRRAFESLWGYLSPDA